MCPNRLFEIDQKTFKKDNGSIILYKRPDQKIPNWICRIKIKGITGYVRRTCGTVNEFDARRFAENLYDELLLRKNKSGSIRSKLFPVIVKEFISSLNSTNKSDDLINDFSVRLSNYSVVYWRKTYIDQIEQPEILEFIQWRRENGKRKKPTETTILKELSPLKQVFKFALSKRYIDKIPEFPPINAKSEIRPNFTRKEYKKLTRNLREWVKQGKRKQRNVYRTRFYLRLYILILSNSGCRIGEIRTLTWKSIDEFTNSFGEPCLSLWVSGKTVKRQVVPQDVVKKYLNEIREFRENEIGQIIDDDEYVFCHKDGSKIGSFKKGFTTFLTEYSLLYDIEGNRHTLYSLRHTYATFRMEEGVNHYLLSVNMGTSVEMLEKHYVRLSLPSVSHELTKGQNKQTNTNDGSKQ